METSQPIKISNTKIECATRHVRLVGVKPLMFDRYAGDNDTQLEPHQKLYFMVGSGKAIYLPAESIMSFLSGQNTISAPKRLLDPRKYRAVAQACRSFIEIEPEMIPILRNGKPIIFGKFEGDLDKTSGIYIHRSTARLPKGIPNPKVRPTLPLPWELDFKMIIMQNNEIKEMQILNLLEAGGYCIGLGTFRGSFGKFTVAAYE